MPPRCGHRIAGPRAWQAAHLSRESDWMHPLGQADLQDLRSALAWSQATGKPTVDTTAGDFPLPVLGPRLRALLRELEFGKGFALVPGFPVQDHSPAEIERMYWGLGSHLGRAVAQNADGDRLVHVRDAGPGGPARRPARAYRTHGAMPFHSDSPDIVGLLCLQPASAGGTSMVASAVTVHNQMLRHHRELLDRLYGSFLYDRKGEERPGERSCYRNCVFTWLDGLLSCRYYLRDYIHSAEARTGLPLSDRERLALDAFDAIAGRNENRIAFRLQPGDLLFCDNNTVVHARTDYQDGADRRDLLRLWLNPGRPRRLRPGSARFRFGMPVRSPVEA